MRPRSLTSGKIGSIRHSGSCLSLGAKTIPNSWPKFGNIRIILLRNAHWFLYCASKVWQPCLFFFITSKLLVGYTPTLSESLPRPRIKFIIVFCKALFSFIKYFKVYSCKHPTNRPKLQHPLPDFALIVSLHSLAWLAWSSFGIYTWKSWVECTVILVLNVLASGNQGGYWIQSKGK